MKILIMIGNSVMGRYFASKINKNIKTLGVVIENKKINKFNTLIKKLGKNPLFYPYKLIEIVYLSLENRLIAKKIKNYFSKYSIDLNENVNYVNDINLNETKEIIKNLKPEIGVILGTSIIKNDIIKLFPKGILNLHTGVLPNYRGLRSEFWALYNNDFNNIGTTIIKIDKNIDAGGILLQEKVNVNRKNDEVRLRCRNIEMGTGLMIKALKQFKKLKIKKQINGKYYSNPNMIESIIFKINKIFS